MPILAVCTCCQKKEVSQHCHCLPRVLPVRLGTTGTRIPTYLGQAHETKDKTSQSKDDDRIQPCFVNPKGVIGPVVRLLLLEAPDCHAFEADMRG
jgi:hypothetical protein